MRECPDHGLDLVCTQTRYGGRWGCLAPGCTVVCWEGSTSTPANDETRALRRRCHHEFDPLWKEKPHNHRFKTRWHAYKWLSIKMGLLFDSTHFGMFNADQCREALAHIFKLKESSP